MSGSKPKLAGTSATLDDCARLWFTLTKDYIPGLRVELHIVQDETRDNCVLVQLVDYSTVGQRGGIDRSVWAEKTFFSPLYLISHTQLFDLLIRGYRVIDEYFSTGVDNRPRPAQD